MHWSSIWGSSIPLCGVHKPVLSPYPISRHSSFLPHIIFTTVLLLRHFPSFTWTNNNQDNRPPRQYHTDIHTYTQWFSHSVIASRHRIDQIIISSVCSCISMLKAYLAANSAKQVRPFTAKWRFGDPLLTHGVRRCYRQDVYGHKSLQVFDDANISSVYAHRFATRLEWRHGVCRSFDANVMSERRALRSNRHKS